MKSSLLLLLTFASGTLSGLFVRLPDVVVQSDLSLYALYLLVFLAGISVGADTESWSGITTAGFKIVLVPVSVIVGSLAGVALVSLVMPSVSLIDSLAVGSGLGYYSLSSVIITEFRGETLGVIALISNLIREMMTLVGAPLLVRYFGKLAPIASGGATSMDTTLPVIVRFSGKEYALISVFSGTVLSLLVPVLVTLIARL